MWQTHLRVEATKGTVFATIDDACSANQLSEIDRFCTPFKRMYEK
jgi:hypothetical protein